MNEEALFSTPLGSKSNIESLEGQTTAKQANLGHEF